MIARTWLFSSFLVMLATPVAAQVGPEETIRKILEEVGKEMQEIDRLLLQSARQPASDGMERNVERLRELMDQTTNSQDRVVRGLDQLIEEIQRMAQQSSSSQGGEQPPQDQQPQDGEQQQPQGQGTREQTQTPDLVRQGEQQGQPEPQDGQDPQDGRDPQQMGQNQPAAPPPGDATEEVERPGDAEGWGDLPRYIQLLHTRGGVPDVPEKYRRAYEAYQRRAHESSPTRPR
jgi:hypothetical protein